MENVESKKLAEIFGNMGMMLLATRKETYDKKLDIKAGPDGTHQPGTLNRNRAAILFSDEVTGEEFGHDWIGVSGSAEMHETGGLSLKIFRSDAGGNVNLSPLHPDPQYHSLPHIFIPTNHGQCSEVAIVNAVYYALLLGLRESSAKNNESSLYILTERMPCASCTGVLNQYLAHFPKAHLHIGYMFDITAPSQLEGGGRVEKDIFDFLVGISGATTAYKVEVSSAADKGSQSPIGSRFQPPGVTSWLAQEAAPIVKFVRVDPSAKYPVVSDDLSRGPGEASKHLHAFIGTN